jgi:hypothetical protein
MNARTKLSLLAAAGLCAFAGAAASQTLTGTAAFGDWSADKPGVVRKITAADIPAPAPQQSVRSFPQVAPRPATAQLQTLPGFAVTQYSDKFTAPRTLRVAPNGDVFVTESTSGRIKVMRPAADGSGPATIETFAEGLAGPFGVAFYPAANPQWVYVGETNAVKRYPYRAGDMKARGPAETIVDKLADTGGGHVTRDIAFRNGRMLVSVGSQSNFAEGQVPPKSPADLAAFEKQYGLGGAWGNETGRASVLSFTPEGQDRNPFANGIRNCVGLKANPATGDVYCAVNERDALGNNLVPDYFTRVKEGGFYGWPWYYLGDHEEPRLAGQRPDLKGKITVPDVLFQAHSAAIDSAFYPAAARGASAFPAEYRGDAFLTMHGSWNRNSRTGYKVVRVKLNNGVPTGEYQDFVTGFVVDNASVWGRPSGVAVLNDGSLLFSDDAGNKLWRVAPTTTRQTAR